MVKGMALRAIALAALVLVAAGCATMNPPLEQRTTQGPTAEEFWMYRVMLLNGRQPNFDERRHWDDQMDQQISAYLREHPEVANSLEVSTFRFYRRVAVGQTKEQVLILLGAPEATTTDQAEMEKAARKYWPQIKGNVTEAWAYPLGWTMYFAGPKLIDITQYLPRR
jgi:hypothetical protein